MVVASNFIGAFTPTGFRTDVGYASPSGGFINTMFSQRFVPSASGPLEKLEVVMRSLNAGELLRVSIRPDIGGVPGASLGEASFNASLFPIDYFPTFATNTLDFKALGISLEAGKTYHAVFRTDSALVSSFYYASHLRNPGAGAFGLPYLHNAGGANPWTDGAFQLEAPLQVSIVPEPSGWVLLAAGLLGSWLVMRRR
jgi:hypothetical protein